jgi:hypothetical protein
MTSSSAKDTAGRLFADQAAARADACCLRIKHCLEQLSQEQVWWRPSASMNSIGNLVLHLCGNLTQWMVHGVRQAPDTRNRPAEFAERGPIPPEDLVRRLNAIITEVKDVLAGCDDVLLLKPRRIQGFDGTVLSAILDSLTHLAGHTQEIVYITRLQLGDRYRFAWAPATREQGAPE